MRHVALSTNQYGSHQIFKLKVQNNKNGCEHLTHNIKEAERDRARWRARETACVAKVFVDTMTKVF